MNLTLIHAALICNFLVFAISANGSETFESKGEILTTTLPTSYREQLPIDMNAKLSLGVSKPAAAEGQAMSRWYAMTLNATHKPSQITSSAVLSYTKNWGNDADDVNESFDNPVVSFAKTWKQNENFHGLYDRLSAGIASTFPGNHDAFEKTFAGSAGPYIELVKESGPFTMTQLFGYSRGFYNSQFAQTNDPDETGEVSPDAFKTTFELDYAFTEKLSGSTIFQLDYATTRSGLGKGRPLWTLALAYELNKSLSIDGGFGTFVGFVSSDAQTDQLSAGEPEAKQAYLELTVAI